MRTMGQVFVLFSSKTKEGKWDCSFVFSSVVFFHPVSYVTSGKKLPQLFIISFQPHSEKITHKEQKYVRVRSQIIFS